MFDLEADSTDLVFFRGMHKLSDDTTLRILSCIDLVVKRLLSSYEILDETFGATWAYLTLKKDKRTRHLIPEVEQQLFYTYPLCKNPYTIARDLADRYGYNVYTIFQAAAQVGLVDYIHALTKMKDSGWTAHDVGDPQDVDWPDRRLEVFLQYAAEDSLKRPLGIKRFVPRYLLMDNLMDKMEKRFSQRYGWLDLRKMLENTERTVLPEIFNSSQNLLDAWYFKTSVLRKRQLKNYLSNLGDTAQTSSLTPFIHLTVVERQIDIQIGWQLKKFSELDQIVWKTHFQSTILKRAILDRRIDCPLKAVRKGCSDGCGHEILLESFARCDL